MKYIVKFIEDTIKIHPVKLGNTNDAYKHEDMLNPLRNVSNVNRGISFFDDLIYLTRVLKLSKLNSYKLPKYM